MAPRPAKSTLFPYTTLFRSNEEELRLAANRAGLTILGRKPWGESEFDRFRGLEYRPGSRLVMELDRKSTRLNSSHVEISYAVLCLKKKINHCVQCMVFCFIC